MEGAAHSSDTQMVRSVSVQRLLGRQGRGFEVFRRDLSQAKELCVHVIIVGFSLNDSREDSNPAARGTAVSRIIHLGLHTGTLH